jgi:hypothetical protein
MSEIAQRLLRRRKSDATLMSLKPRPRALWDTRAEGASRVKQDLLNSIDRGQANGARIAGKQMLQGPGKIVISSATALVADA